MGEEYAPEQQASAADTQPRKSPPSAGSFRCVHHVVKPMTRGQRAKRRIALFFWRLFNPVARALAGWAPWWVVLETTGRRSGRPRQVPLARGPQDGSTVWLVSVHGRHASFARNIEANPRVRLKLARRWHSGIAALTPLEDQILSRCSTYARMGPRVVGIDSAVVRIELDQQSASTRRPPG
jgi:deazaflavin-dependent oxidoreductase (nitroreductase family)